MPSAVEPEAKGRVVDAPMRAATIAYLVGIAVWMLLPVVFAVFSRDANRHDSEVIKLRRDVRGWWYGIAFMTLFWTGLGVPVTRAALRPRDADRGSAAHFGIVVVVVMYWLFALLIVGLGWMNLVAAHRELRKAKRRVREAHHDAAWLQQARRLADAMRTVVADTEQRRRNSKTDSRR